MATKVVMPLMGEGVTDATIIRWLKKEGETIKEYEPLVEVNTDKVDSEVPSPVTGTILKILQPADALVPVNTILAWIGKQGEEIPTDAGGAMPAPAAAPKPAAQPLSSPPMVAPPVSMPAPTAAATSGAMAGFISPVVARVAAEHGVDLARVRGTGQGGRITKEDVLAHAGGRPAAPAAMPSAPAPSTNGERSTFISPVVARLATEHNINLAQVRGTGKDGRITKKDIEAIIAAGGVIPAAAPMTAAPAGPKPVVHSGVPGTVMKLDAVRRSIATHMVQSKHTSPHVTTIMEADMSRVWAHREAHKNEFARDGVNLTFTVYFVSAVVAALKAYPLVNSSWTDEGIAIHKDINVGIAVAMEPEGLIVPVVKNADGLSLIGIARAVNDLAERARARKLNPDEVRGGTFTITNHGTSGSLFATPIINQPQCGILGTGIIQKRAVVINDAIAIRPMVYIGLTFDHRILDGAVADHFLGMIKRTLEEWS